MDINNNLGAAQFESVYEIRQRITQSEPQKSLTEYTAELQLSSPGSAVFSPGDPPTSDSPIEILEADDARVANRKQIREAMNGSIDNAAGHVRLYYAAIEEMGSRGQKLLARA